MSRTALRGSVNWKILLAVSASTFSLIWGENGPLQGLYVLAAEEGQGAGVLAAKAKRFRWAFYFNIETLQRKGSVSPPFNVAQSFLSTSCFSEHSMWLVENLIKQKPFTILWMDFGEICSQCMFLNSSVAALILHILERACEKLAFNFECNK